MAWLGSPRVARPGQIVKDARGEPVESRLGERGATALGDERPRQSVDPLRPTRDVDAEEPAQPFPQISASRIPRELPRGHHTKRGKWVGLPHRRDRPSQQALERPEVRGGECPQGEPVEKARRQVDSTGPAPRREEGRQEGRPQARALNSARHSGVRSLLLTSATM